MLDGDLHMKAAALRRSWEWEPPPSKPETGRRMKATGILIGLAATAVVPWLAHSAAAADAASKAMEPAWMIFSGVSLIALGNAVRRNTP